MEKLLKNLCVFLIILILNSVNISFVTNAEDNPTIHVLGDSTAADYGKVTEFDMAGWGQVLYNFMNDPYIVIDHAEKGTSSKSYYNNNWQTVKDEIQKCDYVIIQFGHNDSKTTTEKTEEDLVTIPDPNRYTSPFESADTKDSYKWYLSKYVSEICAKGAYPVFVTSVERRNKALEKIANSNITTSLDQYAKAMIELGDDLGVPVIDLHLESIDLIDDYETEEEGSSKYLYYISLDESSNDNTHLSREGAMEISRRFVKLVKENTHNSLSAFKNCIVNDFNSVSFQKRLYEFKEYFEQGTIGSDFTNGYNGWELSASTNTTTYPWDDKKIIFKEDVESNTVLNFTAAVADHLDETAVDNSEANRRNRRIQYDFTGVESSDFF